MTEQPDDCVIKTIAMALAAHDHEYGGAPGPYGDDDVGIYVAENWPHYKGQASAVVSALPKRESIKGERGENGDASADASVTDNVGSTPTAPTKWQPIETAPKDGTAILIKTAGGYYLEAYWGDGLMNKAEQYCSGWFANAEDKHPDCWTDGVCWESNADEEPSDRPVMWLPLEQPRRGSE